MRTFKIISFLILVYMQYKMVCLGYTIAIFRLTLKSPECLKNASNFYPKSTTTWTQFLICTSSRIYWSLKKNLQIVSRTFLNYDPEEFWSIVTSADWPATLTMSFILANVAPAAEIGVMATCMCCWSPPVVMPTVAPVIVWYMETGIVTIPGRRKETISSFKYNWKVFFVFRSLDMAQRL